APLVDVNLNEHYSQWGEELRVDGVWETALEYRFGVAWMRNDRHAVRVALLLPEGFGTLRALGLPAPDGPLPIEESTTSDFTQDGNLLALFSQAVWSPAERWKITG